MESELTLFGRLARQWDLIHPYNAAQLVRVNIRLGPEEVREAWRETLREVGMGQARLSRRGVSHEPATDAGLEVVPETLSLEAHITEQMNRPYLPLQGQAEQSAPYEPFRAALKHEEGGTWLGLFYHHPVADSVSIRLLMREWACRLLAPGAGCKPMRFLPRERLAPLAAARGLWWAFSWAKASKGVRRLPQATVENQTQRCFYRDLPLGTPQALHEAAHRHGAKVGDLMLASLAYACDRLMPATHARRSAIAVGAIRDTRPPEADANERFGMRLGFGNLILPASALRDRTQLLREVASQTRLHRFPSAHAAARLELRLALAAGHFLERQRLLDFYRKRLPLAGGLSNVNLSRGWVASTPGIERFVRISPTGPVLPIVLTPTTLGEQLQMAVTWREGALDLTRAHQLTDVFIDYLLGWCAA